MKEYQTQGANYFPWFSKFDNEEVDFPNYIYDVIYGRSDAINRKIIKAFLRNLPSDSPVELKPLTHGNFVLRLNGAIPEHKDTKAVLEQIILDKDALTPLSVSFSPSKKMLGNYYPHRDIDVAIDMLEPFVPNDIWLEELTEEEKENIKKTIKKFTSDKNPVFERKEAKQLAGIFEKTETVRQDKAFTSSAFGNMRITSVYAAYSPRVLREARYIISSEEDNYSMTLYAWPLSWFEFLLLNTYSHIDRITQYSEKQEYANEKERKELFDYLKAILKDKAIQEYEFSEYALLLREKFPRAYSDNIDWAIREKSNSGILANPH